MKNFFTQFIHLKMVAVLLLFFGMGIHLSAQDETCFADIVIGNEITTCNESPGFDDPANGLGAPNDPGTNTPGTFYSLGDINSYVIYGFTDNALVNNGSTDFDLTIYEVGPIVEQTDIYLLPSNPATKAFLDAIPLMPDADGFYFFTNVPGSTTNVDIDAISPGMAAGTLVFNQVKIVNPIAANCNNVPGPDIDAVCALGNLPCDDIDNDGDGFTECGGDCDDDDDTVYPGAIDICDDGKDNNCNDIVDADFALPLPTITLQDDELCISDDLVFTINGVPGAQYFYTPNSNSPLVTGIADANGELTITHPGPQPFNGGLNNVRVLSHQLNGCLTPSFNVSEFYTITNTFTIYFADNDTDGYGNDNISMEVCEGEAPPTGYTTQGGDCSDNDDTIYPGAPELCDGLDNNCDGLEDNLNLAFNRPTDASVLVGWQGTTPAGAFDGDPNTFWNSGIHPTQWISVDLGQSYPIGLMKLGVEQTPAPANTVHHIFFSQDGINWGTPVDIINQVTDNHEVIVRPFTGQTARFVRIETIESPSWVSWNEIEIYELGQTIYYADNDNDGFGSNEDCIVACSAPDGYVTDNTDCNDNDDTIYPGAPAPEAVNCWDEFQLDESTCTWENIGIVPPTPTITLADNEICVGSPLTITFDGEPGHSYGYNSKGGSVTVRSPELDANGTITFNTNFNDTPGDYVVLIRAIYHDDYDVTGCIDFITPIEVAYTVVDPGPEPQVVNCWDEFELDQENCTYVNVGVEPATPTLELTDTDLCAGESIGVIIQGPPNATYQYMLNGVNVTVNTPFADDNGLLTFNTSLFSTPAGTYEFILKSYTVGGAFLEGCTTPIDVRVEYTVTIPEEPTTVNCWDEFEFDQDNCSYVNVGVEPAQPEMVNCYDEFEFDTDACAWTNVGVQPEMPTDLDCDGTAVFNNGTCTWDEIPDENYDCNIAIVLCAGTFPQSFPNFADDTDGDGLVDDCAFTVCDGSGFVSRIQSNLPYASSVSVVVTFPEGLLGGGNPYPAGTVNTTFPIPPMGSASNGVFGPTLTNPTSETLCIDYVLTPNDPQCSDCQGTPVSYQVCFPPAAVEPIAQNCWDDYQYDGALCDYVNQGEQPMMPEMVNCYDEFEFDTDACAWMNVGVQPEMPTDLDCDGTAVFNNGTCTWDEIPDENYDCNIAIVLCAGTFPQSFPNFADDTDGDGLVDDCAFTVCDGSGFVSRIQSNLPYASSVSVVVTFPEGLLGGGNPYPAGTVNTTFPIPPMGSASNGVFGPTLSNPTSETLCIDYVLTPNDPQCSDCQGTPVSYQVCFPPAAVEPIAQNCWDDYQYDGALCDYVNQGEQPAQPEMVNCYDEFEFDTDACAWTNVGVQPEAPTDPDCNGTAVFNNGTCTWDEIPDENYDCNIAIVVCAGTFPQSFPNFADDTDGDGLVDDCAFTVCDGSGFVSRIQSNLPYASSVSVVVTFPEGLLGGGNPYPAGTVNTTFPIPPMGSASNGVFGPTLSNPTSETLCIDYVLTPNDPQCSTCQGTPVSYQVCFPPAAVEPIAQNCWDDYQYDGALCDYVNQGEQPAQPEMVNCYDEFEFDTDACAWTNVGVQPEMPTDLDCDGTAVFNNGTCTWDEIPDENYDCNIAIVLCAGTFPQSFPNFADDTDGDGLVDDCAFTVCDGSGFVSRIQSNLPYASSVSVVVTFPEGLLGGGNPYPAGTVNTTFPIPPMGSASNGVFGPTLTNPTSETLCIDYVLTPNDPQCSDCQGTPVSYQVCFPPAAVEPVAENCWDDYQYDGALCDYVNQGEQPAQPEMVNCYDEFEFDTDACAWTNVGVQPEMPTDLDCDGTAVFNNGTCTWDEIPDENYDCNIAIVLCAGTFPQSFPNFADDTDGDGLVDDCAFTVCDGSGFVSRIQSNLPYASSVSVVVTFPEGLLGGGNPYPAGTVNTTFPIPPMGSASNGVFGPTLSNPTSETLCIDYVLTPNDPQCSTCQGTPVSYQVCFPPAAVEPIAQNCWDDYQYDGALCDYVNQGEQPAQPEMVNCYDEFEFDTDACAWMNVGVQPEAPTDPDCNGTAVFNNGTCTWDEIPDENYDCNIAIVLCAGTFPQSFPNFADDTDGDGLVDDCAFTVCDGSGFVSRIQSNLPYASSVSVVVTFPEGLLGGGNPYPAGTVNTTFPIPPMGSATNGVFGPTLSNPTSETLCIDYVLTPNDPQCSDCQGTPVSYQVCFPPAAVEPVAENCWDDYQYDGALCDYVNQGEQPMMPEMVNCWDDFQFDNATCTWNNIGGDVTDGGHIGSDESLCGANNNPANITSSADASGSGAIEYLWLMNTTTSTPPTTNNMNGWVMIPNSNSPTYDPGPISETTWYLRCARPVGCTDYNGESNIIEKTYEPSCYCPSYGESTDYEWIESISVNGTANQSGADDGYGDYTNIVLPISTGNNSINLTPGFSGNNYYEYWTVYIDYDQSGSFEYSELAYYNASGYSINGNFNVPLDALTGETRMRISMRYGNWPNPCDSFAEGEVEDYTVNITFCDNVTDGGHIGDDEVLCDGNTDPAEITSNTDASGGSGGDIEYLWLMNTTTSSPPTANNMNGWVAIANSNSPSYDPAPISETTWYLRCARRNGCGTYPGESNIIEKKVQSSCVEYCESGGEDTWYEWIDGIWLADIDNTSGNNGGYADFTGISTDLQQGHYYTFTGSPGYNNCYEREYWRVWIDWNQDGDFSDSGEKLFQRKRYGSFSKTIYVPANAMMGETRMRVSMKYGGWPQACQEFSYGETEDYTINVTGNGNDRQAPVTVFHAEKEELQSELWWVNNHGSQIESFELERSADGTNFETIKSETEVVESNDMTRYVHIDAQPMKGDNHYRLLVKYDNGDAKYTEVRILNFADLGSYGVYPNPADEYVMLSLADFVDGAADIKIIDAYGKTRYQERVDLITTEAVRIDLKDFIDGVYFINVVVEGKRMVSKKLMINKLYGWR